MPNKHTPNHNRCAWCGKEFQSRKAVRNHETRKHRINHVRSDQDEAEAQMQAYHQDKMREQHA